MPTPDDDLPLPNANQSRAFVFVTGFVMGAADLVPGVSGGTIAFVFGIYDRLLASITSFDFKTLGMLGRRQGRQFARTTNLPFLITLAIGIATAIAVLSEPLGRTLEHPNGRVILFGFFFGLVVASIFVVGRTVTWNPASWSALAIGIAVGFIVVTRTPAVGTPSSLALFFSGAVAICAMVLPGISGSFILVILGQYDTVLGAVRDRDIAAILIFAAGATIGLFSFARLLRRLLATRRAVALATLTGFMAGSLWKIWPWRVCERLIDAVCQQESVILPAIDAISLWAVAVGVIGGFVVIFVDRASARLQVTA